MIKTAQKTVLLVEDEMIQAMVAKASLEKYGYRIITATDGGDAIQKADTLHEIELILMDIDLGPGMDGTQAAEIILSKRDIPIVFLSSHTEPEVVGKTEKITSYGYVVKNSSMTVLDASIKMAFKLFEANRNTKRINDKLQATFDALPDVLFELDLNGIYHDIHASNPAMLYSPAGPRLGRSIFEVIPIETARIIMSTVKEAHEKGCSSGAEYELNLSIGLRRFEISTSRMATAGGVPRFIILCRDITERKRMEADVQDKEVRLKKLVEILQHQCATVQEFLNYALEQAIAMTASKIGYIYSYSEEKKEFMLNTWSKQGPADCSALDTQTVCELDEAGIWGEVVRRRSPVVLNNFVNEPSCTKGCFDWLLPLEKLMTLPVFRGNEIVGVIGLANKPSDYDEADLLQVTLLMESAWKIVNHKQIEEKHTILLAEKELILKEVHHRIKNNMNMISALLLYQAGTLKESAGANVLEEAGNRIRRMTLLYEKLYQSSSFTGLSADEYLSPLIDEIFAGFPQHGSVKIEKKIDRFFLEARQLQPLGLILNELLTNCMKYAFNDRVAGLIVVTAQSDGTTITVSVADDGIGMPESVDFENPTGFGLVLVSGLVKQLGGAVRIERGNGTRFVITLGR